MKRANSTHTRYYIIYVHIYLFIYFSMRDYYSHLTYDPSEKIHACSWPLITACVWLWAVSKDCKTIKRIREENIKQFQQKLVSACSVIHHIQDTSWLNCRLQRVICPVLLCCCCNQHDARSANRANFTSLICWDEFHLSILGSDKSPWGKLLMHRVVLDQDKVFIWKHGR